MKMDIFFCLHNIYVLHGFYISLPITSFALQSTDPVSSGHKILLPQGSPEPLTVKSENSGFWKNCYTGCPKIRSMVNENDFVTLKI